MAETANLFAVSHVTGGVSTPDNALGAPDNVWTSDGNANVNWTSRWALDALAAGSNLASHTQTITLRVRKGDNTGNPSVTSIRVFQDGAAVTGNLLASSATITATGAGTDLAVTFAGSELSGPAGVSVEIATSGVGGATGVRNAVELDAITWTAVYTPPAVLEGSSALAGSGSVVAAPGFGRPAAAALLAAGAVLADALRGFLLGRATEDDSARVTEDGAARATSIFQEYEDDPALPGEAALVGVGSSVASALRAAAAAAAVTASAVLAADAVVLRAGGASLTAVGVVEAAPTRAVSSVAGLAGVGSAAGAPTRATPTQAALAGAGAVSVTADGSAPAAASFFASGALAAAPSALRTAAADLSSTGSKLTVVFRRAFGLAALSGASGVAADGRIAELSSASLTGVGAVAAAGARERSATANFVAAGTKLAAFSSTTLADAALGAGSGLSAGAVRVAQGDAVFAGGSQIGVGGNMAVFGAAQLTGLGSMAADGTPPFAGGIFAREAGTWKPVTPYYAAGESLLRAIQTGQLRSTELGDVRSLSETEWFEPSEVYVRDGGVWLRTY